MYKLAQYKARIVETWAVRILLECLLVTDSTFFSLIYKPAAIISSLSKVPVNPQEKFFFSKSVSKHFWHNVVSLGYVYFNHKNN